MKTSLLGTLLVRVSSSDKSLFFKLGKQSPEKILTLCRHGGHSLFSCVKILTNLYILFSQVRKLQPRREGDGAAMSDKAIRERQIVLGPMLGGELGLLGSRRNHATQ